MNFRKTEIPYQLCRQILESSTIDYVVFEAAGLLKTALINQYTVLNHNDIISLKNYLLNYVINKPTLAPFVRENIVLIIAFIIKRKSSFDDGRERSKLLDEIENLILNADLMQKLRGCNILSSLMQEYAVTFKASDTGMSWHTHLMEKKNFEEGDLKRIFNFCLDILSKLIEGELTESTNPLRRTILSIVELALTWEFHQTIHCSRLARTLDDNELENPPGLVVEKFGFITQEVDLSKLDLFFILYWKVRNNEQLAHYARKCLVQLANLQKLSIEESKQVEYLSAYIERFLNLLYCITIADQEAYDIANIINNIIHFSNLCSLSKDILVKFIEQLTRVTCFFMEGAAHEESVDANEFLYTEALDVVLKAWLLGIGGVHFGKDLFPPNYVEKSYVEIFNVYIRCHLHPPEGIRSISEKSLSDEEVLDISEEDDKVRFKDQLQIIGNFGRQILNHSLSLLSRALENKISALVDLFKKAVEQSGNICQNDCVKLYEDIHWLVLLAGHVLCLDSEGECASIPSEIIHYCIEQAHQGQIDINSTLQYFTSPRNENLNISEASIDRVVRLVSSIFRLCEIEKNTILARINHLLSPELSTTIMWFLHRWSLCYAILDKNTTINGTILQTFSEESPCAGWIIDFLMSKIEDNIKVFHSEPNLINETINLFVALVQYPKKSNFVLKSTQFKSILDMAIKQQYNFPYRIKGGLMRAIIQAGCFIDNSDTEKYYWSETLQPLQDRFKQLITEKSFSRSYHQEAVRMKVIDILESFLGISRGATVQKMDVVFHYVCPILYELPNLLSLYHNYQQIVQLILETCCECTKDMLFIHLLSMNDRKQIYEIFLRLIQNYARCNSRRIDLTVTEDIYEDIRLLMKLLMNLFENTSDFAKSMYEVDSQEQTGSMANVCLYGFNTVMCLMTMDLLKFPSLCQQYFELLEYVCSVCPEKILQLPRESLQQFLLSIELGFTSFGSDIPIICCNIIASLGEYIHLNSWQDHDKDQLLLPFLKLFINLIVSRRINLNLLLNLDVPLYHLILCYFEQYQEIVHDSFINQNDPLVTLRLRITFMELASNLEPSKQNLQLKVFKKNYEVFIGHI
ncbi:exportin-4-like isoform X2 [Prorops nasuta]